MKLRFVRTCITVPNTPPKGEKNVHKITIKKPCAHGWGCLEETISLQIKTSLDSDDYFTCLRMWMEWMAQKANRGLLVSSTLQILLFTVCMQLLHFTTFSCQAPKLLLVDVISQFVVKSESMHTD